MRYRRLVLGVSSVALAALIGVGAAIPASAMSSAAVDSGSGIAAPQPVASGSPPPDPALALAVAQWVTKGGEDNLKMLAVDFQSLEDSANNNDLPAISDSCTQLQKDVKTAQAYDPIPDAQAQHNWSAALADYVRGATDCIAGADASNADLITKASTEITDGSNELNLVTTRLSQIAG